MQFRFTRMVVLVVGMGVAVSACGQYSISNLRAIRAFKEANELYKKGDYKSAAAGYETAVGYNSENLGVAYFFLGDCYDRLYKVSKKGDPTNDAYLQKAVDNYELAIQKIKNSDAGGQGALTRRRAYEFLITVYGPDKLNDPAKAEPVAKRLIDADPTDPSSYQVLGTVYENAKRLDEAEAMFKKAIDVRPKDGAGYNTLAGFYNRQGTMFEKTMEALQGRANVEPNNPEAWQMIASYYSDEVAKDFRLPIPKQKEYVMKGLEAVNKAMELNTEYYLATSYKNILVRMEAKFEKDPAKNKALIDEADMLYKKALELQKKQNMGKGGN